MSIQEMDIPKSNHRYLYLLGGVLFGLLFPVLGSFFELWTGGKEIYLGSFLELHRQKPLMWIIDSAPVILGVFAFIIGVQQDKLSKLNKFLEGRLESRIQELNDSNLKLKQEVLVRQKAEGQMKVALQQAEDASKAKTEFLSTMSHEIRTPLNAVIGMTGLLLETKLSGIQVDYVRTIKVGGESLLSVINDILDYSKIEAGKLELEEQPFNTFDPLEDVADLLAGKAHGKGLELLYEIAEDVPMAIYSDLTRLRQVLVNLVGNAIKFTEKGEIKISVSSQGTEGGKEILCFAVSDTGIGIPKDRLNRLFKSFSQVDASTTRKYGGTGLGLAICKKIVAHMDGRIWVESEEGKGSTFLFTIKVKKAPVRKFEMLDAITIFQGKRVALIDDNLTNLTILEKQCKNWGFQVRSFRDAPLAFESISSNPQEFDVLITDMQMPHLDGVQLSQKLKKSLKTCPPIVLLSSLDQSLLKGSRNLFEYILTKPAKNEQLFNALARILGWKEEEGLSPQKEQEQEGYSFVRTLLAEDNPVNQKVAKHMLKKLKIEADVAGNGLEALELSQRFSYDLILMDMQMPEMNGLDASRAILDHHKQLGLQPPVIIAMTANSSKEDRETCLEAGMKDFISKPFQLNQLKSIIAQWVGEGKVVS